MNKIIVKAKNAIANKKAEMYVSKAVWVVGVLIVGAMLIWGIYSIMTNTVLEKLDENITSFFTQAGTNNTPGATWKQ